VYADRVSCTCAAVMVLGHRSNCAPDLRGAGKPIAGAMNPFGENLAESVRRARRQLYTF
jgi:hypothetical protein